MAQETIVGNNLHQKLKYNRYTYVCVTESHCSPETL